MERLTGTLALARQSELFTEFFDLAYAWQYREALRRTPAWGLGPGEGLGELASHGAAYAVLSGSVVEAGQPGSPLPVGEGQGGGVAPPRVIGQLTGLRGLPSPEAPVAGPDGAVLLECGPQLLAVLLEEGHLGSRFKVEFYLPLVEGLEPVRDAERPVLEKAIREANFHLWPAGTEVVREGDAADTLFFVLDGEVEIVGARVKSPLVGRGEFFGELAVISEQPRTKTNPNIAVHRRTNTVRARAPVLLMECDRDTVLLLRRGSKGIGKGSATFKGLIQEVYREHRVLAALRQAPLFNSLLDPDLAEIARITELASLEPYEPLFFQGDPAEALYLVIEGRLNVVQETASGPLPVGMLGAGEMVGEVALLRAAGSDRRLFTVTAVQTVDALRIGADALHGLMEQHPAIGEQLRRTAEQRLALDRKGVARAARAPALSWIMETQHSQGEAVLAVDMDDCIRCGNCVTACAEAHADGLSRFSWHGMREDAAVMPRVRLSTSCHHCAHALCMRACPTNAIERSDGGAVVIDYGKCIRCGACADPGQGCPYGSIVLAPADQVGPRPSLLRQLLAYLRRDEAAVGQEGHGKHYPVKCDLCVGLPYQACVHHCPTDAVFRVDGAAQFARALAAVAPADQAGQHASEPRRLSLACALEMRQPGRRAELRVEVRPVGSGTPLFCRAPEPGVPEILLNLFLVAPDGLTIGGGGPLRQLRLAVDRPEATAAYTVTGTDVCAGALRLAIYQGGLYLGQAAFEGLPLEAGDEPT